MQMSRDIRHVLIPDVQKRSRAHGVASALYCALKWLIKPAMMMIAAFSVGGMFGGILTGNLQIAIQVVNFMLNGLYGALEPSEMETRHGDYCKRYEQLYKRLIMCTDEELSAEANASQEKWFKLINEEPMVPWLIKCCFGINGMTTSLQEVQADTVTKLTRSVSQRQLYPSPTTPSPPPLLTPSPAPQETLIHRNLSQRNSDDMV
jgi:hypothetical protein